jgi:imidazoleglycerol-phosphate dehydratase
MTEIKRETKETKIYCKIDINGNGKSNIDTKIGFFNHMLEAFSKHSGIDINLICEGDIEVDYHHSVEDCGIVLGQALKKEIFPVQNIERYGEATIVMDEASTTCDLDLSNRAFLVYEVNIFGEVGNFDVELAQEFFQALTTNSGITCHIINNRGKNKHHILESVFKSFAIAIKRALIKNNKNNIPSTKGIL